jgi:hypothetical protein
VATWGGFFYIHSCRATDVKVTSGSSVAALCWHGSLSFFTSRLSGG